MAKSKGTYNFKGKTAEAITQTVCNDLGIEVGELAQTGIPQKMLCNGMGMYEIIKQAYGGAGSQNRKKYHVEMRQGRLCVDEIGKRVVEQVISSDTNILESSYSLNAEGVVNRVKIYDENDQYVGVVEDEGLIEQVGVFQDVYVEEEDKQTMAVARGRLKGLQRSIEMSVLGEVEYSSGKVAKVQYSLTTAENIFSIVSDRHRWDEVGYQDFINLKIL